jgi:hypothetical protein
MELRMAAPLTYEALPTVIFSVEIWSSGVSWMYAARQRCLQFGRSRILEPQVVH